MLFDSTMLSVIAEELRGSVQTARVAAAHQPHHSELYLEFGPRPATVCLCSAPDAARVHLATSVPDAPLKPYPFCMSLRKHLVHARLIDVRQWDFDRILWLRFGECAGLGPESQRALVAELMGRRSNIILLQPGDPAEPESNTIVACAKHITRNVNRYREILPGIAYVPPPAGVRRPTDVRADGDWDQPPERFDPRAATPEMLSERMAQVSCQTPVGRWLSGEAAGASATFIAEVLHRAGVDADETLEQLDAEDLEGLGAAMRTVSGGSEGRAAFIHVPRSEASSPHGHVAYPVSLHHLQQSHTAQERESLSAALDELARDIAAASTRTRLRDRLSSVIGAALRRAETKLAARQTQARDVEDYEAHRRRGELIMSNVARIEPGAPRAKVIDYADPSQREVEVTLDPQLSPTENAQRHFARYRKARQGAERLPALVRESQDEVDYLSSLNAQLEWLEAPDELLQLEQEVRRGGYIKREPAPKRRRRDTGPSVRVPSTELPEGYRIYYGRNNRQNEYLLRHIASPNDLWLHVKDAPGCHAIIKGESPKAPVPRNVLIRAARIAARNSTLRSDSVVAVDYTQRKHVTKPKRSRPGFVHYVNSKTIHVRP
ncbi:MAG: NFACT family protein [Armatimonadota bacterium]